MKIGPHSDAARRRGSSLAANRLNEASSYKSEPSKRQGKPRRRTGSSAILFKTIYAALLLTSALIWTTRTSSDTASDYKPPQLPSEKNNVNRTTLALLYPPGLLGGYRNQVLRFVAFCVHAKRQGLRQLLLPSILWNTQLGGIGQHVEWFPIPMDWVFDVDHWNSFAEHLPVLVNEIPDSDCWISSSSDSHSDESVLLLQNTSLNPLQRAALQQGSLRPISNVTLSVIAGQTTVNPRWVDFLPQVQHCQNPVVFGGGTKAGRLWNAYINFQKSNNNGTVPFQTDKWIYRALRPAEKWRRVAEQCVRSHVAGTDNNNNKYMALHARVELEIMSHVCGNEMERNLTKILERVQGLAQRTAGVSGLFVAVSRAGMEVTDTRLYQRFRAHADDNLQTLNRLVGNNNGTVRPATGLGSSKLPVFECGERILNEYYAQHPDVPDHGSLLQSVINFYVATAADVFVGVRGSSYSTDVWTTRYYQGLGASNYRYTVTGVEPVENGGLPKPHTNCKRKPKKKKKPQ